jgi:hypothetical protein
MSLATLGHVDAADQLAASLQASAFGSSRAHANISAVSSTFDFYRTAASLRRRLQNGDAGAAAEAEQLLRGGGARLLLLKLHRAVVLQLLISGSRDEHGGSGQMQVHDPHFIAASLL